MYRILIVAHAPLGSAVVKAASDILGKDVPVYSLDTRIEQAPEARNQHAANMIDELLADGDLLVLVDFLGGTPSNVILPHLDREGIEILTGFNLPLVFKAVSWARDGKNVTDAAKELVQYAANHIERVADRLSPA